MRQLDFYGGEHELPLARPHQLTYRQRELVGYLHSYGPLRAGQVKTHADPWGALRRLEALGLASHGFDGRWNAR